MQLRVPKRYQARKRNRELFKSKRVIWLFIIVVGLGGMAYMMLRDPEPFREGAGDMAGAVQDQVEQAREDMFPEEPTATPDVRGDRVECDNAYLVGNMERVIETCRRALLGNPNDVELHYRLAYTLVVTSSFGENTVRINEAIEIANRTIAANPESPLGYAVRAMALDWSGQFNLALGSVERALEIDPNSIIAKAHLSNIYRNLGQGELAQETIEEALVAVQANPEGVERETRAQVYRNYGRILFTIVGESELALEAYAEARRAMPSHTYITIEMADVYFYIGGDANIETAFQLLLETLDVAPRDLILLERLGIFYVNQGQREDAIEMLTRCVEVAPDHSPCLSELGALQYFAENYALTVQHLGRATELGSTNPYDWYLLGRAYTRLSQCNLAEEPLREGYRLRQDIETERVGLDNFIDAFRQCGLSEPSQAPSEIETETKIPPTS